MRDEYAADKTAEEKIKLAKTIEIVEKAIDAGYDNSLIRTLTNFSDAQINELRTK